MIGVDLTHGAVEGIPVKRNSKPTYTPAHTVPVWLSSQDVKNAILQMQDADKATLWDVLTLICQLEAQQRTAP